MTSTSFSVILVTVALAVLKGTPPKPPSVAVKPGLNRAAYEFSFAARNHREIRRNRSKTGTKKPRSLVDRTKD